MEKPEAELLLLMGVFLISQIIKSCHNFVNFKKLNTSRMTGYINIWPLLNFDEITAPYIHCVAVRNKK